jgi:hypothetical protein
MTKVKKVNPDGVQQDGCSYTHLKPKSSDATNLKNPCSAVSLMIMIVTRHWDSSLLESCVELFAYPMMILQISCSTPSGFRNAYALLPGIFMPGI